MNTGHRGHIQQHFQNRRLVRFPFRHNQAAVVDQCIASGHVGGIAGLESDSAGPHRSPAVESQLIARSPSAGSDVTQTPGPVNGRAGRSSGGHVIRLDCADPQVTSRLIDGDKLSGITHGGVEGGQFGLRRSPGHTRRGRRWRIARNGRCCWGRDHSRFHHKSRSGVGTGCFRRLDRGRRGHDYRRFDLDGRLARFGNGHPGGQIIDHPNLADVLRWGGIPGPDTAHPDGV